MAANGDCETGDCPPAGSSGTAAPAPAAVPPANGIEDPLNWRTFAPPLAAGSLGGERLSPSIVVEFCNRCRWLHRATWVQTELFLTFEDKPPQAEGDGQGASSTGGGGGSGDGGAGKYAAPTGVKSIQLIPCNAPETGGRFRVWLYRQSRREEQDGRTGESSEPASKTTPHGVISDGSNAITLLWDRKVRGGFPELKELKQMVRDQIAPSASLGHSDKKGSA